jgi:hypothetical protein
MGFYRAEARIREYCEIEVYRDRNYKGEYDDRLNQNVSLGESRSARYYWRSSLTEARKEFGAVPCKRCRPSGSVCPASGW